MRIATEISKPKQGINLIINWIIICSAPIWILPWLIMGLMHGVTENDYLMGRRSLWRDRD